MNRGGRPREEVPACHPRASAPPAAGKPAAVLRKPGCYAGPRGTPRRWDERRGQPGTDYAAPGRVVGLTRPGGERFSGAVTAEFAVALPAVLLLLALLLAGSAAGVTQLRLEEAARAGARSLARGEDAAAVKVIVRRLAGDAAASVVDSDGEWLSVTVSGRVSGSVGALLPWTLSARAWARGEASKASALVRTHEPQQRRRPSQAA